MRLMSALPGRLRLQSEDLKKAALLADFIAEVAAIPGVMEVSGDVRIGTIKVLYDCDGDGEGVGGSEGLSEADLLKRMGDRLLQLRFPKLEALQRRVTKAKRRGKKVLNLHQKSALHIGMSLTLGSVLASAVFWHKRIHVASGIVFSSIIGLHLIENRRNFTKSMRSRAKK